MMHYGCAQYPLDILINISTFVTLNNIENLKDQMIQFLFMTQDDVRSYRLFAHPTPARRR